MITLKQAPESGNKAILGRIDAKSPSFSFWFGKGLDSTFCRMQFLLNSEDLEFPK
jgi:hypothetical protein